MAENDNIDQIGAFEIRQLNRHNEEVITKYFKHNGKIEGKYIVYTGVRPIEISEYVNGKLHGQHKIFNREGKIKEIFTYDNGELHGKYICYEPQIQKLSMIECNYVHNKKDGTFNEYWKNGRLFSTCTYVNNDITGKYIEYNENGSKRYICNYFTNLKNGECYVYHPTYTEINYYRDDNLIESFINKNGRVHKKYEYEYKYTGSLKNSPSTFIEYYENGNIFQIFKSKVSSIFCCKKLQTTQYYIVYYEDGKIHETGSAKFCKKEGKFKEYNNKGKLCKTGIYKNNTICGKFKKNNENGKIIEINTVYNRSILQ